MEKDEASDTLEMQVWNLCLKYTTVLENCGYFEFMTQKPELAVEHILKRLSHSHLKNCMLSTIKLNRDKGFKKNFKNFINELAQEASFIDRINSVKIFQANVSGSDDDFIKRVQDGKTRNNRKRKILRSNNNRVAPADSDKADTDQKGTYKSHNGARKRHRELPDCLNSNCSGKHFHNDCPFSSAD